MAAAANSRCRLLGGRRKSAVLPALSKLLSRSVKLLRANAAGASVSRFGRAAAGASYKSAFA